MAGFTEPLPKDNLPKHAPTHGCLMSPSDSIICRVHANLHVRAATLGNGAACTQDKPWLCNSGVCGSNDRCGRSHRPV